MKSPVDVYLGVLGWLAGRKRSHAFKMASMAAGWFIFLVLVPACLIRLTWPLNRLIALPWPSIVSIAVAAVTVPLGLCVLGWATFTQWRSGSGTPLYTAPTEKLVVTGPYQYCRNPIQLGAVCYYLGLGAWFGSVTQGMACFLLSLAAGSAYHYFIEEKELARRFGEPYLEYKRTTPFLFPRCPRRSSQRRSNLTGT